MTIVHLGLMHYEGYPDKLRLPERCWRGPGSHVVGGGGEGGGGGGGL